MSVFRQCMTVLYMVKDQHPQAVKEATSLVLPVWLDAFKVLSFIHYYISAADSPPRTSEDETIELPDLIVPIVDFIAAVARGGKAKLWFDAQHFPALVSAVFKFTQVGEQDVSFE